MFRKFKVEISFRDKLLGGRPKTADLFKAWLGTRDIKLDSGEDLRCVTRGQLKQVKSSEIKATSWNTFEADADGLFIEERNVKAMLRDAGVISGIGKRAGFADAIRTGVFTKPERIHLKRDGSFVKAPDGHIDRIAILRGRCKPRTALKRLDFVQAPQMDFDVWIAAVILSDSDLLSLFTLGQEVGLGACRSQGFGKFDAKIVPIREPQPASL